MTTRILGIDPGSRITGFAILESSKSILKSPVCDVIHLEDMENRFKRLLKLYSEISSLILTYKPDYCAIETPVYAKDPSAMLKLGRAQAAVIMSVLHHDLPLSEYYPKAVKKAITGSGNANKKQVAYMLYKLIEIPENHLPDDATDALAVAWCHYLKLDDPEMGQTENPTTYRHMKRNSWRSFIENNPDRVRKS